MSTLEDAFLKLDRGKEHAAQYLQNILASFSEYRLRTEIKSNPYPKPAGVNDIRPWEAFTLYISDVPMIGKRDEILLGEAIQNFRSSLDYLAWAWAIEAAGRCGSPLTEEQERQVLFPMATREKKFDGLIKKRIPNVTGRQKVFIKQYQPYKRSEAGRAMRYLMALSNTDKHRIIIPALISPQVGDIQFKFNRALELIKEIRHLNIKREIKAGTKLMTVVLAGTVPQNEPKVHVDTKITFMPIFPKDIVMLTSSNDVVLIEDALNRIGVICTEILTKAKDKF